MALALAHSFESNLSALVRDDGKVEIWDWQARCAATTLRLEGILPNTKTLLVSTFSFSSRQLLGCAGALDTEAYLWCLHEGNIKQRLVGHALPITAVALASDGHLAATGSEDATVKVWSTWGGQCLKTFEGHAKLVSCLAFSPDGPVLASGSMDCTVRLWCLETGACTLTMEATVDTTTKPVPSWDIQPGAVLSIAYSNDGEYLAFSQENGVVDVCPRCVDNRRSWAAHESGVGHVVFAPPGLPSGRMLATSSARDGAGCVKLWDLEQDTCLREFKLIALHNIAFSSSEHFLTVQSFPDWSVRLWEVHTGKELGEHRLHDVAVAGVGPWG